MWRRKNGLSWSFQNVWNESIKEKENLLNITCDQLVQDFILKTFTHAKHKRATYVMMFVRLIRSTVELTDSYDQMIMFFVIIVFVLHLLTVFFSLLCTFALNNTVLQSMLPSQNVEMVQDKYEID